MVRGQIEVICGGMFSGKTEELMRRLRRAKVAKLQIQAFKSALDQRYHPNDIQSHDARLFEAQPVSNSEQISHRLHVDTQVIGIDEVQFLDAGIISLSQSLADQGKLILLAGLDQDSQARAFGPMPNLLAIAESITKLSAICVRCGQSASRSFYKKEPPQVTNSQIIIGQAESYEARCRKCHNLGRFEKAIPRSLTPNKNELQVEKRLNA